MTYLGDFALGKTFDLKFTTVNTSGVPTTLAGTPVISAYPDNSVTQLTAGITLTVDFDSITGLHNVRVVATSGNGYAAGSNYQLVITTGTVGGNSVVGYVVGQFSIEARSSLRPTTADRTLDISAGGEAGLDWANIGSPAAAQNLSATNIDVDQVVASVSGAVGSVTGAVGSVTGNVSGNVTGSVGSLAAQAKADVNAEVDTAIADARLDELLTADSDIDGVAPPTVGSVFHELLTKTAGSFTYDQTTDSLEALRDNVGTNGAALSLAKTTNITGFNDLSAAQVNAEADTALTDYDAPTSAELVSEINSVQADIAALNNLSAAQVNAEVDTALADVNLDHIAGTATGIPAIPAGTYIDQMMDDGTAVYDRTTDSLQAIRDRGDAAWDTADVSTLALQSSVDDLEGRLTAVRAGYLDNLSAGAVALEATAQSVLTAVDTEVAAIKAKTDQLTFTTANQVDSNALAIDSSAAAATHLKDHSLTAVPVTFSGGTTTTAVLVNVDGAAASGVDDFYNGRVLIFTAPGGLKYQATDITDYVGATKTATITAVTTAVGATTTAIMV